jgi:hypothetical protein
MGVLLKPPSPRMYHRPLNTLLVTWGVSLILQQAARDIFGALNVEGTCRRDSNAFPNSPPRRTCNWSRRPDATEEAHR